MKSNKKIIEEVVKKMREKYNLNVVKINMDLILHKKKGGIVRIPAKKILSFNEILKKTIKLSIQKRDEKVLKLIEQDINFQKQKLKDEKKHFDENKPFQWRIAGMKYLKSIIKDG